MKLFAPLVALVACVGCAQVDQGVTTATDVKRQANDLQVRVWLLETCDLSLGGIRRSDMSPALRQAVLEYCLQDAAPDE